MSCSCIDLLILRTVRSVVEINDLIQTNSNATVTNYRFEKPYQHFAFSLCKMYYQ